MAIVEIGSNQKKLVNMILIKNNIMGKKLKKMVKLSNAER